jgi:putative FmdB family regulatory protein
MPTYLYECNQCHKTFEENHSIKESARTDCLLCDAKGSVKRLIQPTAILFKGDGFYVNDKSSAPVTDSAPAAECSGEPKSCPACSTPETPKTEVKPQPED